MPTDDFVIRYFFELAGAAEMLRFERFVAEHLLGGDHAEVFVGGHGGPEFVEEGTVVDAEGGCDDFGETGPVLVRVLDGG